MSILQHTRLLVVLLFFCALAFGLRSREIVEHFTGGSSATPQEELAQDTSPVAVTFAQIEPAQGEEDKPEAKTTKKDSVSEENKAEEKEEEQGDLGEAPPAPAPTQWTDAQDEAFENSGVQAELFEDLSQRRKDIEKKEKELAMRDALLKAAELELEQKFGELESLKSEIEVLLKKQSEEEEARINSLVKIYEGMKAKDAARIFNTLETEVLLSVLGRMSERKSAPIIAAMEPDRARSVTILLAEQKSLPNLSSQ